MAHMGFIVWGFIMGSSGLEGIGMSFIGLRLFRVQGLGDFHSGFYSSGFFLNFGWGAAL